VRLPPGVGRPTPMDARDGPGTDAGGVGGGGWLLERTLATRIGAYDTLASGCRSPLETTKGSSEHHVIGRRMVGGLGRNVVPA
jgi:hypothetical protein